MASEWDDKARVYALADPAAVFRARDVITRAVLEVLQVAPSPKHHVTVSGSSGWLYYVAEGELWERKLPPSLPSQADALRAAELVLTKLERQCSALNKDWPAELRAVPLLPPVNLVRRVGARAVARPTGATWDHWLYRAQPHLLLDGAAKTKAIVFGAQIEIRIGHLGQVIGIHLRWRPLSGERQLVDFVPFRPPTEPESQGEKRQPPVTLFILEGDGIPQYYLAPYYLSTDGHDLDVSSASTWSLTVDIGRTAQDDSRMTLTALAQGGSGDYRYNWAVYVPSNLAAGWRELGSGSTSAIDSAGGRATSSSVQLDNGHYIVMLNVKDRKTGAFKHHQQQVFSSPFRSGSTDGSRPLVA